MLKSAVLVLLAAEVALAAVTPSDWISFNGTLNGRLQRAVPFARSCFTLGSECDTQSADPTTCALVQARHEARVFRSQNFGAYENTQWETCQKTGDQCLLDWRHPWNENAFKAPQKCLIGNVPPYFIEVQDAEDVKAAIKFVRATKVPLVIKNTGHDYSGRSAGAGSLALWTHKMKKLEFHRTYVPTRCVAKPVTAMTIGAGSQFGEIYAFASQNDVTFLGGSDASVGASGGWIMGAGHSLLSPALGLGVDRVLEFKVVTADGEIRIVNKCQNPDLFFALRGGGGGTFAVVLESTHLVTPRVTVQVALGRYNNTKENSRKLMKSLAKASTRFALDGWGGYITPHWGSCIWGNPIISAEGVQNSTAAIAEAFASVNGSLTFYTMPNWEVFYNNFISPNGDPVGRPQILASRFIEDTKMANDAVIDAYTTAMLDSDFSQILSVGPYGFKNYDKYGSSINPKWRTSVWHVFMSYDWNFDSTMEQRLEAYQKLNDLWKPLRDLTPGAAVYGNEADVYEPDHEKAFWGTNYAQLLYIKNKYDPERIFDCWHCVGWKGSNDDRFKCYPKRD